MEKPGFNKLSKIAREDLKKGGKAAKRAKEVLEKLDKRTDLSRTVRRRVRAGVRASSRMGAGVVALGLSTALDKTAFADDVRNSRWWGEASYHYREGNIQQARFRGSDLSHTGSVAQDLALNGNVAGSIDFEKWWEEQLQQRQQELDEAADIE